MAAAAFDIKRLFMRVASDVTLRVLDNVAALVTPSVPPTTVFPVPESTVNFVDATLKVPDTSRVLSSVVAPVTPSVLPSVVAPVTPNVPPTSVSPV